MGSARACDWFLERRGDGGAGEGVHDLERHQPVGPPRQRPLRRACGWCRTGPHRQRCRTGPVTAAWRAVDRHPALEGGLQTIEDTRRADALHRGRAHAEDIGDGGIPATPSRAVGVSQEEDRGPLASLP